MVKNRFIIIAALFLLSSTYALANPCQDSMSSIKSDMGEPSATDSMNGGTLGSWISWDYPDEGLKKFFHWRDGEEGCRVETQSMPLSKLGIDKQVMELRKEHPKWSFEVCRSIIEKKVVLGMNSEQVTESWGSPLITNKNTKLDGVYDTWSYNGHLVQFINDRVVSIQVTRSR